MFENLELDQLIEEFGENFEGCNKSEIEFIEAKFKLKLPLALVEYLKVMGKKSGGVFSGADVEYEDIEQINEIAQKLLKQNSKLEENPIFAFSLNQGYAFYAIKDFDVDDPCVYSYIEGDDGFEIDMAFKSFTEYLKKMMMLYKKYK